MYGILIVIAEWNLQFISEYLIESIEMLSRIANPKKPPLNLEELEEARNDYGEADTDEMYAEMKIRLAEMEKEFRRGRGDLPALTPELLADIDKCFVNNYMEDGEPAASLFFPNSADNLNRYERYCDEVEVVLQKPENDAPRYALHYFRYYSIWEMRETIFPLPLGTATVVGVLNKMTNKVRRGFCEVSRRSLIVLIDIRRTRNDRA